MTSGLNNAITHQESLRSEYVGIGGDITKYIRIMYGSWRETTSFLKRRLITKRSSMHFGIELNYAMDDLLSEEALPVRARTRPFLRKMPRPFYVATFTNRIRTKY